MSLLISRLAGGVVHMVAEWFQAQQKQINPCVLVIFESAYVTFVIDPLAKASHKAKPRVSVDREYPRAGCKCSYFCK